MQILIVVLLVSIVASLGHALSSKASGAPRLERSQRMAQALTMRIAAARFARVINCHPFVRFATLGE